MKKVIVVISDGFEEIETITIIDVLRRANIEVTLVAIKTITTSGAHNIKVEADTLIGKINHNDFDMVVLPGGLPNAFNLAQSSEVIKLLKDMQKSEKIIAAICAAPYALHKAGVLNKNYTCYPSFEKKIRLQGYSSKHDVVIDDKVITSRGPGTAISFSLELVKHLSNQDKYLQIKTELLIN